MGALVSWENALLQSLFMCPLVNPFVLVEKVGVAEMSLKLNSDLAKCDYLEWVCIRFVCKYSINH